MLIRLDDVLLRLTPIGSTVSLFSMIPIVLEECALPQAQLFIFLCEAFPFFVCPVFMWRFLNNTGLCELDVAHLFNGVRKSNKCFLFLCYLLLVVRVFFSSDAGGGSNYEGDDWFPVHPIRDRDLAPKDLLNV